MADMADMSYCQAEDCPAATILYEKLNRIENGLLVCDFCFARSLVSEKTYNHKKLIKKPHEKLIRIPVTSKNNRQLFNKNNEDLTYIRPLNSTDSDLEKLNLFIENLDSSIKIENQRFDLVTSIRSSLNPVILYSSMGSLLIFQSLNDFEPLKSSLDKILDSLLVQSYKKSHKIKLDSIDKELRDKYWRNSGNINIIKFDNKIIPLKQFIDIPEYSLTEKLKLIKDLSIIWLLWACGYKDIIDSLFIETDSLENLLNLTFVNNNNFITVFSKESEKSLFQDFALYLPYLLEDYSVFKEEMIKLKEKFKSKLVDQNFKELYDFFNQGKDDGFPIFDF